MTARRPLTVRAVVKARSRQAGVSVDGGILRVAVRSPPVEGRANAEATALIASAFGVPKTRVELLRGMRSRIKHFRIFEPETAPDGFEP